MFSMSNRRSVAIALCALSTFAAPASSQKVVDLPIEDRPLGTDFEEVFRVGDGPGAWERIAPVFGLGFDREGNLYIGGVGASGQPEILIVTPEGELKKRFGRAGRGPGEFLAPAQIVVLADGRTVVPDQMHMAHHLFLPDGELERMVRFPGGAPVRQLMFAMISGMEERTLKAGRGGELLSRLRTREKMDYDSIAGEMTIGITEGPRQVERILLDGDEARSEVVLTAWAPPGAGATTKLDVDLDAGPEYVSMTGEAPRTVFVPKLLFDVLPGGGIVYSDSSAHAIKVADSKGEVTRILRRSLPARPVTERVRQDYERRQLDALPGGVDGAGGQVEAIDKELLEMQRRTVERMEFYSGIPLVDDLWTTWEGTIWMRRTPKEGYPWTEPEEVR